MGRILTNHYSLKSIHNEEEKVKIDVEDAFKHHCVVILIRITLLRYPKCVNKTRLMPNANNKAFNFTILSVNSIE